MIWQVVYGEWKEVEGVRRKGEKMADPIELFYKTKRKIHAGLIKWMSLCRIK